MLNLDLFRRRWKRPVPETRPVLRAPLESHSLLFGHQVADQPASAPAVTVVVIGNCISEGIVAGLSSSKAASSRFRFAAIPLHLKSLQHPESLSLIAEASHVFVQQLGGIDWDLIASTTSPSSQTFSFPSLVQNNLWPFDFTAGHVDEVAQSLPEGRIRHFDGALARLRKIEPDKKKRIARYRDLDFDWATKIDAIATAQARFLEQIDTHSDCYMGRFIERNQRDRQLFYNATHPSAIIFQELCEYCWRKLEMSEPPPTFTDTDGWRDWSVPVHPVIARRLGVVWAHEATRYRYVTLGDVTWQEWVEAYVETFG